MNNSPGNNGKQELSTLCYLRRGDETLMLHRNKRQADVHFGKWNGLGGKIESGESPEECVIREVAEESGLLMRNPKLHAVMTFPAFGGDTDCIVFLFSSQEFEGELIDSPEGELKWIKHEAIKDLNLWEGDKVFLPWLDRPGGLVSAKFTYEGDRYIRHEAVYYD